MLELWLFIVGILLLSGFFSGAEAALLSITEPEVEEMRQQKAFGVEILRRVRSSMETVMVTIVIMNNVVNIAGSVIVGQLVVKNYGSEMLGMVTTALTFGVIIFSEILPKALGVHYAPALSRWLAFPIFALSAVLYPITFFVAKGTVALKKGKRHIGTEQQIRSLVTLGRHAGYIESDEGQLIHRAFILNDKKAKDVMTPLKDVVGVQATDTVRQAADKVFKNPYSRYPVFGQSIHDVLGIVMSHDILEALTQGKDDEPVTTIKREGLVVSALRRCDQLIVLFRDKNIHLAVVQEDAHTIGLVTLEDVLEELVGEIEDETDVEDDEN